MSSDFTEATRRLLLSRIRWVMLGVGAVAALLVLGTWVVDEGEIVKITTRDARGREYVTEVWIVDLRGEPWLRAASPDARWLQRIRENPVIEFERDGATTRRRVTIEGGVAIRERVNRAMRQKYGLSDRLWGEVSDRSRSIPLRLSPPEESLRADEAQGGARADASWSQ